MTYNLVGKQYGRLKVLEKLSERDYRGKTQYKCLCICGDFKVTTTNQLTDINKGLKTCGKCEWHIRHKEAYISWSGMKQRCDDKNCKDYPYYGGRGIKYDPRWSDFVEFFLDMGDPPKDFYGERKSIDRSDVNLNYTKDNCKWSDRHEQQMNKTMHSPKIESGVDYE